MNKNKQSPSLALFDFDGTISTGDTYTRFIFYSTPKGRLLLGFLLLCPVILFYKLRLLSSSKTRPLISKVALWNRSVEDVSRKAECFVEDVMSSSIRVEALERIQWHKSRGDRVCIVSASLNPYLKVWCDQQKVDLLCTDLEIKQGRYTGRYITGDCSHHAKVRAIQGSIDLTQYSNVYAYGDTPEDLPMLALANYRYYRWQSLNS